LHYYNGSAFGINQPEYSQYLQQFEKPPRGVLVEECFECNTVADRFLKFLG
jgi:hypothetical protein